MRGPRNVEHTQFRAWGLPPVFSAAVAAGLLLGGVAQAGEKIKITDSPDHVQLPKDQELRSNPANMQSRISGGESSQGPILPPPNATPLRNPKLDELIDRKKNWIYESPNDVDRDQQLHEIYGVRKYELDGWDKKPKSQAEKYFESKDAKKNGVGKSGGKMSTGPDALSNRSELDRNSPFGDPEEGQAAESAGIIQALNPAPLFNWDMGTDAAARFGNSGHRGSAIPRGFAEAPFGQKPFNQPTVIPTSGAAGNVERPWDYRTSPILGKIGEPISGAPDLGRTVLNPISARKASVPAPETSQSRTSESYSFGSAAPVSTRPELFGTGRDKPVAAPSYAPPVATPVSTPAIAAKPAMLEIPRPRF